MAIGYLSLGSNQGDRASNLHAALVALGHLPHTRVCGASRFVATDAVGGPPGQPGFLNAAAALETQLAPAELLAHMQQIELAQGRVRREHWGARSLDLDLLLWDGLRIEEPGLVVPHPHMHYRRFVLEPLVEIAPQARHPDGWTVAERWAELTRLPHYLACTGLPDAEADRVARALAQALKAEYRSSPCPAASLEAACLGVSAALQQLRAVHQERERLLAGPPPSSRWLVTDFWLGESAVWEEVLREHGHTMELPLAPAPEAGAMLAPTLVIWLGAPEAATPITRAPALRAELHAAFQRRRRGLPQYSPRSVELPEIVQELRVVAAAISGTAEKG